MISSDSPWYKFLMYGLEKLGRYYSSYRGFVVDNEDPKGLGRIKVINPTLNQFDNVGIWAFPKGQWGGKDYGVNLLPLIGDMVWVEFEHGDIRYPIWQHASYGTDEKPEEFSSPQIYGFKTPAGNIIIIDDSKGKEYILVKRKGGSEYIHIEANKNTLEATKIYLGKDGDEKAVMGETLQSKMEQLHTQVSDLANQVSSLATGVVSVFPGGAAVATACIAISAQTTLLRGQLSQILSNKVKIDK